MTPQERINAAQNLDQLAEILNDLSDEEVREVRLDDLPTFGEVGIENTMEVFSWDEKRVLTSDGWKIQPRCHCCGEAEFHCLMND